MCNFLVWTRNCGIEISLISMLWMLRLWNACSHIERNMKSRMSRSHRSAISQKIWTPKFLASSTWEKLIQSSCRENVRTEIFFTSLEIQQNFFTNDKNVRFKSVWFFLTWKKREISSRLSRTFLSKFETRKKNLFLVRKKKYLHLFLSEKKGATEFFSSLSMRKTSIHNQSIK